MLCTNEFSCTCIVLSFLHSRLQQTKRLPEMVHDYNAHTLGVDRMDLDDGILFISEKVDQVVEESVFWVLEVIVNNAHIVYKMHTSNSMKLSMKEFR